MKKNIFYTVLLAASFIGCSQPNNGSSDIESKVDSLLSQMTIEEKLGQMNQLSPWDFDDLAKKVKKSLPHL